MFGCSCCLRRAQKKEEKIELAQLVMQKHNIKRMEWWVENKAKSNVINKEFTNRQIYWENLGVSKDCTHNVAQYFGDIAEIEQITDEELIALHGIGKKIIEQLREILKCSTKSTE